MVPRREEGASLKPVKPLTDQLLYKVKQLKVKQLTRRDETECSVKEALESAGLAKRRKP